MDNIESYLMNITEEEPSEVVPVPEVEVVPEPVPEVEAVAKKIRKPKKPELTTIKKKPVKNPRGLSEEDLQIKQENILQGRRAGANTRTKKFSDNQKKIDLFDRYIEGNLTYEETLLAGFLPKVNYQSGIKEKIVEKIVLVDSQGNIVTPKKTYSTKDFQSWFD